MGWMQEKKWTTKDGRVMEPKDFEDSHLLNTIKFIEDKAPSLKLKQELYLLSVPEPHGDAACYCFEAEQLHLQRMSSKDWLKSCCKIYNLLVKEAVHRKLIIEESNNA